MPVQNGGAAREAGDAGRPVEDGAPARAGGRFKALGCLMTVAGFFSGAMVAVLIAKVRGAVMHCQPPDPELPACDWQQFAGVGGILGAVSLPVLVFWRLRMPRWRNRDQGAETGGQDL
jgi:hypothetical protein